ncbi:protein HEG homolog 1 isoform X2 [Mesocricetus auratus]|uniref:Protein HEG homolog 1 isoform X2 n=1 Tax=Mesocricetus auratus TaxID=10036 RepID=A0ABM2XVW0_MESAU|nr:protein HEG homolog 1 isoform X2 [Mesocricetus auratus]
MASPRAPRWPPPPPLLLLLLLLLPPPATPRTRGPLPSLANHALLPAAGPPLPPGPGHTAPGPGVTTRRGRSGRVPRGVRAATARSHWTESNNTEPHIGNTPFYPSQEDHSGSRKGVTAQTARMSRSSSGAPENPSFIRETSVEGKNTSSSRANTTVLQTGHSTEITTALTAHALESLPQSPSSPRSEGRVTSSQTQSGIFPGFQERVREGPEEGTLHTQVAGTWVSSQASLPAVELGDSTMFSQKRNPSGQEPSRQQFSWTQSRPPPSDHPSSSGSIKNVNNSTDLQSPSVTQTKSTHVTNTFTNGVPRMLRSLTVSAEPINETESFSEHSRVAITSASVHSSPSVVDSRTNSRLTGSMADGEGIEPSTENGLGLPSIHWQSDSPTFGGHQLASSSEPGNGSATPLTETVFRSVPSIGGGESTGQWFPGESKTSTDPAESSALHPDAGSSRGLTQLAHTAQQPRDGSSGLGGKSYSESASTSASESLDSSAPQRGHSTPEDDTLLRDSSDLPESTSRARALHTSVMLTQSGERTLRSLGFSRTATHPVHPTPRGNVTEHTGLLSRAPTLGVTGLSYGQEHGSDAEQRTSSGHTDHAYVPSAFTKGERALLSITENSSSSDTSESSTSSIKISDSPHLDFSSSQAEGRNVSSHDGGPAQSSTESLVLHTSSLPSYTSTINVPDNLVLDAITNSVEDPSDSGAPSSLPSVSQPHQFSSAFPSTGSPIQQLKSTSETATPSSSSLSPLPISLMVSTLAPHSASQTDFPHSSSTLVPPRAREPRVTSVQMSTVESAIAAFPSNQTADPKNQSAPQQEKTITEAKSPSLVSLPTDSTKAVTMSLPPGTPWPPALMGSSTEPALPATSTTLAQMSPALTSSIPQTTHAPMTNPSTLSSTEASTPGIIIVHTTPEKQRQPTNPEILVPPTSTEGAVTTEGNRVRVGPTTPSVPLTTTPTSAEVTTMLSPEEEASPISHFLRTSSPQTTDVSTAEILTSRYTSFTAQSTPQSPAALSPPTPVNSCTVNPCLHDGECIVDLTGHGYRCVCPPAWQGDNCSVDVDECLSSPCPPLAMCNNTQGSFTCRCPVGYQLEKGICNLVRTFVTEFKLKKTFLNTTVENHSDIHEVENEIAQTLNLCFSTLPGYIRSTVGVSREPSTLAISLQSTFALASNVTLFDLADGIQKYVNSCRSSAEVCQLLGSQRRIFRAGSLCKRKSPECDRETSICTDLDGVALCQCKSGYFQFNKMDHSCRACEDGYRLENETCMSCPFGLGGLNCGNPYQLITVVIAAAGGGLLLILGIALIVTCCRKSKNDISKLIFKSGDFQMSPYAEYPKNPRSQEWGREAIEMHENGSTKNLLQMTDVYYSPANVRNPELERNGLYPAYTGLPGSRHSCIFPGQYNPSFISDESRRRDYF